MNITVEIDDAAVKAAFARLAARLANTRPLMTRIGAFYERSVLENFRAQRSPGGQAWQPLSAVTLALMSKRRGSRKKDGSVSALGQKRLNAKRILHQHGDLEASIHPQASENAVTIGSSASILYAAIHQLGGKTGRGHKVDIPARPYLAENEGGEMVLAAKDRAMILEQARDYLLSAAR
ncbi:MAG: phage virion morphogenesis protein [Desulfobulbaceae bacterium]|jgi:phage virion morphogenesis protein|nr:phage virion morphogenesis protein [Desulfobulbaceae bacterium]